MRLLPLLAALLAALLAGGAAPAASQPALAPSDSVRLERVLDALAIDRVTATPLAYLAAGAAVSSLADGLRQPDVRAAVRARLAAGFTLARADSVLAARADGRWAAYLGLLHDAQDPQRAGAIAMAFIDPPKKGVLADSAAAARFAAASGLMAYLRQTMLDVFTEVAARVPAAQAELDAGGHTLEALVAEQVGDLEPMFVLAVRMGSRDRQQARTALAVAESDAGRWATSALWDGLRDAFVPAVVEALIASVPPHPPPPPPPPARR